jgi:hypothetical protein
MCMNHAEQLLRRNIYPTVELRPRLAAFLYQLLAMFDQLLM